MRTPEPELAAMLGKQIGMEELDRAINAIVIRRMPRASVMTRDQLKAFLASLWPRDDRGAITNTTRIFFAALLGRVPTAPPSLAPVTEEQKMYRVQCSAFASVLRGLADELESETEIPW